MSDVFQVSNGVPGNFDEGEVELVVNGTKKGKMRPAAGQTLGAFLKEKATLYGVRTFSAFADGRKLDTTDASKPLTSIKSIEIVAKDARGTTASAALKRIKIREMRNFFNFYTDSL
jgi:hypothetical protein